MASPTATAQSSDCRDTIALSDPGFPASRSPLHCPLRALCSPFRHLSPRLHADPARSPPLVPSPLRPPLPPPTTRTSSAPLSRPMCVFVFEMVAEHPLGTFERSLGTSLSGTEHPYLASPPSLPLRPFFLVSSSSLFLSKEHASIRVVQLPAPC